jgi:hypothetical protein
MKRVFLLLGCLAVFTVGMSSCASMKRDCQVANTSGYLMAFIFNVRNSLLKCD